MALANTNKKLSYTKMVIKKVLHILIGVLYIVYFGLSEVVVCKKSDKKRIIPKRSFLIPSIV